jgi:DNA-binding transcriptional LysR family regulator
MNLRGVDLNLLPILHALLRESSVTGAARTLSMSQPAVSHALGRLRTLFGDPLLVQVGRQMRMTARAERLLELTELSSETIKSLFAPEQFDPADINRRFTIATPDYLALVIGRSLITELRETAPGIAVDFVDAGQELREKTLAGPIDPAVIANIPRWTDGLSIEGGYLDDHICVGRRGHPALTKDSVTWRCLAQYRTLEIVGEAEHMEMPPSFSARSEPVGMSATQMMVLPFLALASDTLAVVPRALARLAGDLISLSTAEVADSAFELCLAWSPVEDSDKAHQWMRGKVSAILAEHCLRPQLAVAMAEAS